MTNGMMAERVSCCVSIFAVHSVIWEGTCDSWDKGHSVGEVKHWLAKGFLPEQSFLNSNIFYGVGVKEAVVDSLNVIYSILLIEHVE